jgi:hypothetical protein
LLQIKFMQIKDAAKKKRRPKAASLFGFELRDYCFEASQRPLHGMPPEAPFHSPEAPLISDHVYYHPKVSELIYRKARQSVEPLWFRAGYDMLFP